MNKNNDSLIQRQYYEKTANSYDGMHLNEKDEHYLSLCFLESVINFYSIKSILDIGAGTGRVALYLKSKCPNLKVMSIEPVEELRNVAYGKGLSKKELIDGDVNNLIFKSGEFDLVCEFGVLHHLKDPSRAVEEMLRVSKRGIFISDSNNFGQGTFLSRTIKQIFNALGLWRAIYFIKTKGRGFDISDEDGLYYSYSVFNNYKQINTICDTYFFNTHPNRINSYRTSPHVALLGIKK